MPTVCCSVDARGAGPMGGRAHRPGLAISDPTARNSKYGKRMNVARGAPPRTGASRPAFQPLCHRNSACLRLACPVLLGVSAPSREENSPMAMALDWGECQNHPGTCIQHECLGCPPPPQSYGTGPGYTDNENSPGNGEIGVGGRLAHLVQQLPPWVPSCPTQEEARTQASSALHRGEWSKCPWK